MPQPKSGRQIILERLQKILALSTTADIQRAAMFLEQAKQVRDGCRTQRTNTRQTQATAWKKKVDNSITW